MTKVITSPTLGNHEKNEVLNKLFVTIFCYEKKKWNCKKVICKNDKKFQSTPFTHDKKKSPI